jgi:hypothetical protein
MVEKPWKTEKAGPLLFSAAPRSQLPVRQQTDY